MPAFLAVGGARRWPRCTARSCSKLDSMISEELSKMSISLPRHIDISDLFCGHYYSDPETTSRSPPRRPGAPPAAAHNFTRAELGLAVSLRTVVAYCRPRCAPSAPGGVPPSP
ncbi:hypothetical protein ACMD2_20197 [Ananas comosus]|uniref:Uncharacterized protein n=1 Tax=Ananas comosus TaxID=4615 RepID=A0A199ULE1_ANACO|nr:hypothetical protein ACMD2_20197 [Ananas comosus]